ncbi:MAG: hypothetical protein NVV62_18010 [Terricaulis sp.]|nr:hypothetical protein [Terricaulis sp.]
MEMPIEGADRELQSIDEDRRGKLIENAPRGHAHALTPARAFEQHGKFIAAKARGEAIVTDAILQARGDHLQQLIANGVAMHVIDRLEAIKIDEQKREGVRIFPDQRKAPLKLFQEMPAIGEPGERIVPRQRLRARFSRFAFRNFRNEILRALLHRALEIVADDIKLKHRLAAIEAGPSRAR